MRKHVFAASIMALSVVAASACATKGFVREEVGSVNTKVDTLGGTVEQAQQRIGQNEARIGAVDQKAEAAGKAAADARTAATEARGAADQAAGAASAVGGRVDTVAGRVDTVAADVASSRKLIYAVTLSEDQGKFTFGRTDLPDEAKARLDQMIDQLKANPQNVYIEVEGHTDNVGSIEGNERLGLERAESVKRYLYEQHRVPLHKINVISYGEEKPVAPNNTRDGRSQNRRVVVKVLT